LAGARFPPYRIRPAGHHLNAMGTRGDRSQFRSNTAVYLGRDVPRPEGIPGDLVMRYGGLAVADQEGGAKGLDRE